MKSLLTTITLTAGLLAAVLILPSSAQSGGPRQAIPANGCFLARGGALSLPNVRRLRATNATTRNLLDEEQLWMSRIDVDAKIYLFDQVPNAFAEPDGNVYLGVPLVDNFIRTRGLETALHGIDYVMAHEYGHQFQFRILRQRNQRFLASNAETELQADVLAGYWLGLRLHEEREKAERQGAKLGAGWESQNAGHYLLIANDIGDTMFSSPGHHGTPASRHSAVQTGFEAGRSNQLGGPTTAFSLNADSLYNWSRRIAATLVARE